MAQLRLLSGGHFQGLNSATDSGLKRVPFDNSGFSSENCLNNLYTNRGKAQGWPANPKWLVGNGGEAHSPACVFTN